MIRGAQRRNLLCGVAFAAGVIGFSAGVAMLQHAATAQETMVEAPIFEVDPLWPKPLPNEALLGMTIGISIDDQDNVWLGGNGAKDSQILKFTKDGKFLMQSGHQGKNAGSNDPENFGRVAQIYVDPKTNEVFAADGYKN